MNKKSSLKKKVESSPSQDEAQSAGVDTANGSNPDPQAGLLICPQCRQKALFWNRHTQIYKCVNPKCKQGFTIDEYQRKEVQEPPEEPVITETITPDFPAMLAPEKVEPVVTEPILSSHEPIIETKEKVEPLIIKPLTSNVPIIPPPEKVEPIVTEPITLNLPVTEAAEKREPLVTEPIASNMPIIPPPEKVEPIVTEQIPPHMPAIETKDKVKPGITQHTPSKVTITKTINEAKAVTKTPKQINRNLALLFFGVLVVGLVVLGILVGQKSGGTDDLTSELNNSRQALAETQTQLAASQQNVEELRTQLTEAQQEIAALQAAIEEMSPQLIPSEPYEYSGEILGGGLISIPIELKRFERVEGTITTGYNGLLVYIHDSGGSIVKDFGRTSGSKIVFTAQTSDTFSIVIKEPTGSPSRYTLKYTIYQRQ